MGSSLKTLWEEGGIGRLYQGLPFALVQGPMTRFGDTAANVGILALLESSPATQALPLPLKTACGSFAAGVWRIVLMPIDTSKTAMQVEGADGLKNLWNEVVVKEKNPSPLYRGALASAAATAVGHFPWFLVCISFVWRCILGYFYFSRSAAPNSLFSCITSQRPTIF